MPYEVIAHREHQFISTGKERVVHEQRHIGAAISVSAHRFQQGPSAALGIIEQPQLNRHACCRATLRGIQYVCGETRHVS